MRTFSEEMIKAWFQKRRLKLVGEIDGEAQEELVAQILYLNALASDPITLFIDCDSGNSIATFALANAIRSSPAPVHGIVECTARSGGFDVLQSCAVRKAFPNASLLFHASKIYGPRIDQKERIQKYLKEQNRLHNERVRYIARRTGQDEHTVREWSLQEREFTAPEAKKVGLLDEIL